MFYPIVQLDRSQVVYGAYGVCPATHLSAWEHVTWLFWHCMYAALAVLVLWIVLLFVGAGVTYVRAILRGEV